MATQGACDWCAWSFSWGWVGERWRGPDAEVEIHRRLRGAQRQLAWPPDSNLGSGTKKSGSRVISPAPASG